MIFHKYKLLQDDKAKNIITKLILTMGVSHVGIFTKQTPNTFYIFSYAYVRRAFVRLWLGKYFILGFSTSFSTDCECTVNEEISCANIVESLPNITKHALLAKLSMQQ